MISDTPFVSQDSDNAANSSNCMNLFVPRQQLPTGAFWRSFKTSVDVFHKDVQLITIKGINRLLYLGWLDREKHLHYNIQGCVLQIQCYNKLR